MSTKLDPEILERARLWLHPPYDKNTSAAVKALIDEEQHDDLKDAFYKDLEFGTGGMRGIMGVGSNRVNSYTLGKATQGLSNYLHKVYPNQPIKAVVSYDSRNHSQELAKIVANVFSANGIFVYFFEEMRPTPLLSFAIRELACQSGVMLTASHNPKEYNGYKAYWKDGGQLVAPHDINVTREVNAITSIDQVKFDPIEQNIKTIGKEIDDSYLEKIRRLSLNPDTVRAQRALKIVYSPIHGTGVTLVPKAMQEWGFRELVLVKEQAEPNGDFPTVIYPNPEEEEAMSVAVAEGKKIDADLVLATDPDADRVGVAVKNKKGDFQLLNGNQIGSLLVHYVLSSLQAKGALSGNGYVVKTIVTSKLIADIAEHFDTPCFDVLTGFKFIGELITSKGDSEKFLVGGEESYGFLIGDLVRDKDAVISCVFIAEMAAFYKNQKKTLFEALIDLYSTYGFYKEKLISLTKKGMTGAEEIRNMMINLRKHPPVSLGGVKVVAIKDYQSSESTDVLTGKKQGIDLPKSNVLQFITEEGDVISARPSGTEPKIKFYCSVKGALENTADYEKIALSLDKKMDRMMKDLTDQ